MSLKRNHFLDAGHSDEEDAALTNSASEEDTRGSRLSGLKSRTSMRQKLSHKDNETSDQGNTSDGSDESQSETKSISSLKPTTTNEDSPTEPPTSNIPPKPTTSRPPTKKLKPLTPAQLVASRLRASKTGVIYLSRIPPFMRPSTVRHLLSAHGTITRLFLTPEAPATHLRRQKSGGNKKRSFIDGWIEFAFKRDAKNCARSINGQIIGGKKGGWYHDDIWNIKYLKGFKWEDLMEGVRAEERGREARMRAEIGREVRERRAFLEGVDRGKKAKGMEKKRARQAEERGGVGQIDDEKAVVEGGHGAEGSKKKYERRFRQNEVKGKDPRGTTIEDQSDEVRRILGKIF